MIRFDTLEEAFTFAALQAFELTDEADGVWNFYRWAGDRRLSVVRQKNGRFKISFH